MNRKLRFRNLAVKDGPVAVVHEAARQPKRAVYFQVADRPIPYNHGKNRIVYIGATKAGHERIMSSLSEQIPYLFRIPGVNRIEVHMISCEPRQRVKTWLMLERACLLIFREKYGEPPWENTQGRALQAVDEFQYFDRNQVRKLISTYER